MAAVRSFLTSPPEPRRTICPACKGTRVEAALTPACATCGATWTPARFDAWQEAYDSCGWRGVLALLFPRLRYRTRWERLPCWHPLEALSYREQLCRICHGVGTVSHFTVSADIYAGRRLCPLPKPPRQPHHPSITPMPPSRETALDGERERIWWRAIRRHP